MTPITIENFADYPKGTKLEFHFGAYYPTVEGIVTGYEVLPATKWFPSQVRLLAEYNDINTDEVVQTTVTQLTDKGIGVYLLEPAAQTENVKSPWRQYA